MKRLATTLAILFVGAAPTFAQGISATYFPGTETGLTHPNPSAQSIQGAGPSWELGPVIPVSGSVAMCTATEGCDPVVRIPVIVDNNCALSEVESLIGHPIEITEQYDLSPRVFSAERMAGTMDYWPWRFNVFVDADGMITQAFCG